MERIVMTMPIKPQKTTNVGMYIAPTLMNLFKDLLECEVVMAINTLNSYSSREQEAVTYFQDLYKNGIHYDKSFIDKSNANLIVNVIEQMIYEGFIEKSYEHVFRCDCGKVDILEKGLSENGNGKLYYEKNGEYFCVSCGSICKKYNEKILTLYLDENVDDRIMITPTFLKNDAKHLSKIFKGSKLLISKYRDTGYTIKDGIDTFNIDIDFMWANYFQLFNEKQKILLASNHQILQMYLLNYLNNITRKDELYFVANPYVSNAANIDLLSEYEKTNDEYYKKLFILYNLRWKQKDCVWSKSVIDYLSNISNTRRLNLYKTILLSRKTYEESNTPLDVYLEKILINGTNMQKNIVDAKMLVKK